MITTNVSSLVMHSFNPESGWLSSLYLFLALLKSRLMQLCSVNPDGTDNSEWKIAFFKIRRANELYRIYKWSSDL